MSQEISIIDRAKKAAAKRAIDEYLKDNSVIGIGNGATVAFAVQRLAERVAAEDLSIVCIATSYDAHQLIKKHGLAWSDLETYPNLDFTIDGADEVDAELNVINGGGSYFTQGKIIATCSKQLITIADYSKMTQKFGGPNKKRIAIEVIPLAYVPIRQRLQKRFGGSVELKLTDAKYGPLVTDIGNFILDWDFPNDITDWHKVNTEIMLIPGVVETGIFLGLTTKAYFGMPDGSVKVQSESHIRR
ncbi:ribose-5-phosphate isomerase-like [Diprion similis]|uniref:ribose-5-phosphate isomerase-like n=1 Tax=Diprion similis TaxID=362088 RepID=UPI001EF86C53|nr:ribose-5-phosphate isomerase-like [Diprion similis]